VEQQKEDMHSEVLALTHLSAICRNFFWEREPVFTIASCHLPPVFSLEFGRVLYSIYVMYDACMATHDCDALTTREFSAC